MDLKMPAVSQPDSAGLQLSPIEIRVADGFAPQRAIGEDGIEVVSGPHTVRPPSYASNRQSRNTPGGIANGTATTRRSEISAIHPALRPIAPIDESSGNENTNSTGLDTPSDSEASEEPKPLLQEKKKHWGLTWRQWILVLAPSFVIIAIASIVAGVVVSRENANSSSSLSSSSSTPAANTTYVSKSGAFNGTDIALASPGLNNETTWMFYQDFEGDLSFAALDTSGIWHQRGKIPTINGMANGSAITAMNFPLDNPTHINLLYVDSTGQIRNKLYKNGTQQFEDGFIYKKIFTMPPNLTTVRRMSWYADDNDLFYMYAGGTDGFLHEYTYDAVKNEWQPTSDFAASNGFSGATVTPTQTDTNLSTLHVINTDGNLEYWTRPPPGSKGIANSWTRGASSQDLPLQIYTNGTLQLDKGHGQVLFQDTAGEIHAIGFRGNGTEAQWNAPSTTGIKARLGTSIKSHLGGLYEGLDAQTHVFMQLNGNDITHLVRANSSALLTVFETPIQ